MIFVIGALSASGELNLTGIYLILVLAAIIGDTVNYHVGKFVGVKLFQKENVPFFNKKHLIKTHEFYEKHGGKTIILARFVPIIRTFAPFVAGMGSMNYFHFLSYNIVGGVAWVTLFIAAGYFFGNIPVVERNFSLVIFGIIIISVLPAVITYIKEKRSLRKKG